jgi:hypothetical protein
MDIWCFFVSVEALYFILFNQSRKKMHFISVECIISPNVSDAPHAGLGRNINVQGEGWGKQEEDLPAREHE